MRRVVSVWFPTLPTDRLRQPEEGQGAALDPQRADGPFDPINGWVGGGGSDLSPPRLPLRHPPNGVPRAAALAGSGAAPRPSFGHRNQPSGNGGGCSSGGPWPAARDEAGAGAGFGAAGLRCMMRTRYGDAALLRRLAEWCLRYAPLAAVDPPDGLVDRRHRQRTSAWRGNPAAARSGRSAEVTGIGGAGCRCRYAGCRACGGSVWRGRGGAAGHGCHGRVSDRGVASAGGYAGRSASDGVRAGWAFGRGGPGAFGAAVRG